MIDLWIILFLTFFHLRDFWAKSYQSKMPLNCAPAAPSKYTPCLTTSGPAGPICRGRLPAREPFSWRTPFRGVWKLQSDTGGRMPWLGWLRFGIFHHPVWAIGSYSSCPSAGELSKSKSSKPRYSTTSVTLYSAITAMCKFFDFAKGFSKMDGNEFWINIVVHIRCFVRRRRWRQSVNLNDISGKGMEFSKE